MQKYKTFCKMRNFQLLVKSNPVCFVFFLYFALWLVQKAYATPNQSGAKVL